MIRMLSRFTSLQRTLHWLMAVCILTMFFVGVGMVSTVAAKYLSLIALHKTLGVTILVLALLRLGVRLRTGAPALPAGKSLSGQRRQSNRAPRRKTPGMS